MTVERFFIIILVAINNKLTGQVTNAAKREQKPGALYEHALNCVWEFCDLLWISHNIANAVTSCASSESETVFYTEKNASHSWTYDIRTV